MCELPQLETMLKQISLRKNADTASSFAINIQ